MVGVRIAPPWRASVVVFLVRQQLDDCQCRLTATGANDNVIERAAAHRETLGAGVEIQMRDFWPPSTDTVSADVTLWRYFRPKRLVDALTTSTLYFAAPTEFDDKFEGAVRASLAGTPVGGYSGFEALLRNRRSLYKINCWHEADCENNMMWQLYATTGRGVAIRTTLAKVRKALKPYKLGQGPLNDVLWCGRVKYIDFEKDGVPSNASPPVGPLKRLFYKHLPFRSEREFRFVVDLDDVALASGDRRPSADGVFVDVNLEDLVEAIVLGPNLAGSDEDKIQRDLIREAAISAGLSDRIVASALEGTPRYL